MSIILNSILYKPILNIKNNKLETLSNKKISISEKYHINLIKNFINPSKTHKTSENKDFLMILLNYQIRQNKKITNIKPTDTM